jgi:hypothetical protein
VVVSVVVIKDDIMQALQDDVIPLLQDEVWPDSYEAIGLTSTPDDAGGYTTVSSVVESGICYLKPVTRQGAERVVADRLGWISAYAVDLPLATICTPAHTLETEVTVTNHVADLAAHLRPGLRPIVQKTGMDMVAIEQTLSRVDTGAMKNGWAFEMTGDVEGVNYNPVEYTPYNEYGTVRTPAQPMLHPAVDQVTPGFMAAVEQVLRGG